MSRWTHVRGGMELVSGPYEFKNKNLAEPEGSWRQAEKDGNKELVAEWEKYYRAFRRNAYLPFPEEQMVVSMPLPGTLYWKKNSRSKEIEKSSALRFTAYIKSLPRARKYIDEAFSLIADNECGLGVRYSLEQNITDSNSSSSCFSFDCDLKEYKKAIDRMYASDDPFNSTCYDRMKDRHMIQDEPDWVEHVNKILVGVRDDVRHCSGMDFMNGLEKALKHLKENGIDIEDGYLEWQDEYEPGRIYAWRSSRLEDTAWRFMVLDRKTNSIIWQRKYLPKKDAEGEIDFDARWYDTVEEGTLGKYEDKGEEDSSDD